MKRLPPSLRPTRIWLLVLAAWTVPGLVSTAAFYIARVDQDQSLTLLQAATWMFPFWYLWAAFTPLVIWLARRLPLEGSHRWRNAGAHLILSAVFAYLHLALGLLLIRRLLPGPFERGYWEALPYYVRLYFEFDIVVYGAIVGASYAYEYYRRSRRDALRAAELEVRLAHAHLQALKMQLQPHFLFNTLHTVSSLMDVDVKAARRMLARLGDLLRLTLDTQGIQEVPLEQELGYLELYLDIERERFPDRLHVDMLVSPEALNAMVPNLVLQPLVENAVRYGIAPRPEGGKITLSARREDGRLKLTVMDDGGGPVPARDPGRSGVGLGNTRARLEELYGPEHEFVTSSERGSGFTVEIVIPYRIAVEARSEAAEGRS